jgi:hypothetical protein
MADSDIVPTITEPAPTQNLDPLPVSPRAAFPTDILFI